MPRRFLQRELPLVLLAVVVLAVSMMALARPAAAQSLTPGTTARIQTDDGGCLRLRSGATLAAGILTCLPNGSLVSIRDGSTTADGFTWQFVEASSTFGWVAALYLVPLGGEAPAPTSTPAPAPTSTPAPTPAPPTTGGTGTITGSLPANGKPSLVIWGGGSAESMIATAAGRGCGVTALWATRGGQLIRYTPSAPAFVNRAWVEQVGSSLPPVSPLIVICAAASTTQTVSNPSPGTAGTSPAPSSESRPPGPGGNE